MRTQHDAQLVPQFNAHSGREDSSDDRDIFVVTEERRGYQSLCRADAGPGEPGEGFSLVEDIVSRQRDGPYTQRQLVILFNRRLAAGHGVDHLDAGVHRQIPEVISQFSSYHSEVEEVLIPVDGGERISEPRPQFALDGLNPLGVEVYAVGEEHHKEKDNCQFYYFHVLFYGLNI